MKKFPVSVNQIVEDHLCVGCGACAGLYPEQISMVDTKNHGKRPVVNQAASENHDSGIEISDFCPGIRIQHPEIRDCPDANPNLFTEWGPVLEVWEGHASDSDVRYRGSSGGLTNALALFCIEQTPMRGALHVKPRKDSPILNESAISTNRLELLEGSGSRYAPASPCDKLHEVEHGAHPVVVIGKPCDIAAANAAASQRKTLGEQIGLTISIFCAGTPSLAATHDLMKHLDCNNPAEASMVRYRGHGWPGQMTVERVTSSGQKRRATTSYAAGWGDILQKKRQWRCHLCADHTGELADLSVGDPWYRPVEEGDPGKSLLVVRTPRGRKIVRDAIRQGYIIVEKRPADILVKSQPNLLKTRGANWGRLVTLSTLGVPTPSYPGLRTYGTWKNHLDLKAKAQSIYGTLLRVFRKKLYSAESWERYQPQGR